MGTLHYIQLQYGIISVQIEHHKKTFSASKLTLSNKQNIQMLDLEEYEICI